ncbi:MAG: UDP-N-acetylglucosamine 2-epimerase (non-hydrolyzing) [Candidatus Wallbacteria bacterium]|nr:UDP-N-acetylglucosamine 2-epimerase (non-hydrolyzing) [Candidatus Wallbacteria bacterium]
MKIVTIIGARPQFIKASPVSAAIAAHPGMTEVIVHTGQHFDHAMSDIFFSQMGIPAPDYNLNIHSLSHGAMTGRMLEEIEKVLTVEKPDTVLVYGDTNSTLAGALAAAKLHIPVAHVEAGLRSRNMRMPEEINRIMADRVSSHLFCPTATALSNLKSEGFESFGCRIELTGDVMFDSVLRFAPLAVKPRISSAEGFVLSTLHRQENTASSETLSGIAEALSRIALTTPVVLPLHPRTRSVLTSSGLSLPGVEVIDPVGYLEMLWLLNHCSLVMTDSGGLQKEAFFSGRPCVTLRHETEWTELVDMGYNVLSGSDPDTIMAAYSALEGRSFKPDLHVFGDGHAAEKIIRILAEKT